MTLVEHALQYCEMGLSVIPLRPRDKKPLIVWEPYQERRAEAAKIWQWWTKWPDANIGIVTGKVSGLVVIDCDSREAMKTATSFIRQNVLEKIPLVSTAKGFHLYFRHPGNLEIGNRGDLFKDPSPQKKNRVDVRGDGGYVVAPPSIHETGRRYAWACVEPDKKLADRPDLPPELLTRITMQDNNGEPKKEKKPKAAADNKPLFEKVVPSRSINRKTGQPGKPHHVKLMPSGNWRCSCDAFAKGHNDCWVIQEERAAWEAKHASRAHK